LNLLSVGKERAMKHRERSSFKPLPKSMVFELVKRATGLDPAKIARTARGYDNEVYFVKTRGGKAFIARVKIFGGVGFRQEAWAIERCREAGVPVPMVFLVDEISLGGRSMEVMVQSKVPGKPLSEVQDNLSKEEFIRVWRRAGEILGRIHSVKVDGFWRRLDSGKWSLIGWRRYMHSIIRDRSSEKNYILSAGFSREDFSFMLDMLRRYRDEFPCDQPVLCHGDFLPEHIFVNVEDGLEITGVIDFGEFQGAPNIHDFAVLSFECPTLDLSPLLEGYPYRDCLNEDFELRLNLHKLALLIGYLAHHMRIGNVKEAESNTRALRETLKTLKEYTSPSFNV